MKKLLENKIAVVTGGADGIGKATALRFAEEGAVVVVWDMNVEKGENTVEEIKQKGSKAVFMQVNTAKYDEVSMATTKVVELYGKADILINNAGITRDSTIKKMTPEIWQQVIDVNLTGVFNCCKCMSDVMVENGWGRIINASSVVALYGNFGQTNYVATKAGIDNKRSSTGHCSCQRQCNKNRRKCETSNSIVIYVFCSTIAFYNEIQHKNSIYSK